MANLTHLKDKVNNREIEVEQSVKSNQALTSKAINPVSEGSGTIQETPFIMQGTATANNTSPVDTSPVGKHLEKQGNTICYNQLIDPTSEFPLSFPTISGVRYLEYTGSGGYLVFTGTGSTVTVYTSDFKIVNLDKWFNGNIPSDILSNPAHFAWYYNGAFPYSTGELVSSNGEHLISTGRNAWNEDWEAGGINSSTGENINVNNAIRSKSFSICIPSVRYRFNVPSSSGSYSRIFWYDKNKTFISASETFVPATFSAPPHAYYFKIGTATTYGNTYKNDITVSIYYSTGEDYDKYFAYTSPISYATGNEVLRKAGSAKDTKEPDGTITRRVGTVDLGTLNWTAEEIASGNRRFSTQLSNAVQSDSTNGIKSICSKYEALPQTGTGNPNSLGYTITSSLALFIHDPDLQTLTAEQFKAAMSGVYLYYELATPTTEQGTAFTENIQIEDYGAMWWLDTNNEYVSIPQGTKLFYPADYVNLIDSLNSYTNGDVTKLAKKSDLATKADIPTYETYVIQTTDWSALSSSTPYTYSATVTATATISADTVVELINDNPVLFATYGFAIGGVNGQNITIYSIGEPDANVSLTIGIGG